VVELVDTHVSGACVARREGSSPSFGTLSGTGNQELGRCKSTFEFRIKCCLLPDSSCRCPSIESFRFICVVKSVGTLYNILLVGTGGMLGSIARYLATITIDSKLNSFFPYGTFTVNILGSMILGVVVGWVNAKDDSQSLKLLLATGFCGGFTTFSTFALENITLIGQRLNHVSIIYTIGSLVAGMLAVVAGLWLSKFLI
jgi:CrcB protein